MRQRHLALGLVVMCVLAGVTTLASADYTDNMVARWTFLDSSLNDDATGGSTNDAMTLNAGSGTAELLSGGGSGVLHTASDGVGNVSMSDDLKFTSGGTNAFTVWVRFKLEDASNNKYFIFMDNMPTGGGWYVRLEDSATHNLAARSAAETVSGLTVTDTEWHEAAFRFGLGSTGKVEFYLDGASTGMNCDLNSNEGGTYRLGMTNAEMTIEEIRVYNAPLSDSQCDQIEYVVPEPATMSLLTLGGLGMLIRRKR